MTEPSMPTQCYACGGDLKEVCDSCGSETANHECQYNMPEIVLICLRSGNLPGDCDGNEFGMPMTVTLVGNEEIDMTDITQEEAI